MVEDSQQEMMVIPLKLRIVFCTVCCPRCPESPDPVLITEHRNQSMFRGSESSESLQRQLMSRVPTE